MNAILDVITRLFNAMISYAGVVVSFITQNPLILMFVVLGLVGIGVGFIKRLIRM